MSYRVRAILATSIILSFGAVLGGCNPATDVSREPSAEELQQAQQKRAAAAEKREGLTPEQLEGLRRYNQGGGSGGRSGPPTQGQ